jgi:hypothetical protein
MPMPSTGLQPAAATVLLLTLLLAAGLVLAATPDPLLPNGGFEAGAAGWSASGGQLAVVTEPVRTGSRAGRLAASGQSLVAFLESGFITVTAGTTYTLTGAVYFTGTAVTWTQLRITWYSDTISTAMPVLPQSAPIVTPTAAWQVFSSLVATPPAGAHAAKVRAVAGLATLNQPGAVIFDDLSMQGPQLPAPTASATAAPSPSPTSTVTVTVTATPSLSQTPTTAPVTFTTALPGVILITEVQAHPASGGGAGEWLELHNRSGATVAMAGWRVEDNHGSDPLPAISLPPGAFVVAAADPVVFRAQFPGFAGPLVAIADGLIGNGLADDGDRLLLRDGAGTIIDGLSYGADASVFSPAAP